MKEKELLKLREELESVVFAVEQGKSFNEVFELLQPLYQYVQRRSRGVEVE